jgi:hypothetical protein
MTTYVIEIEDYTGVHVCPVVKFFDLYGKVTPDPRAAVSGVVRVGLDKFLEFDTSIGVYPVH